MAFGRMRGRRGLVLAKGHGFGDDIAQEALEDSMIVYGIATCDTTKAAIKALQRAGREVTFRDIRAEPLSEAEIAQIVAEFGSRAVNKQSTTYRSFTPFLREAEPEAQIAAQPTVMKRPVIQDGAVWHLGWDDTVQGALGL